MTWQEAIDKLKAEIESRGGKYNLTNLFDSAIGIAAQNTDQLQAKLNDLLSKKGIITPDDEAAVKNLVDEQNELRKQRRKQRVTKIVTVASALLGTGVTIYLTFKSKKK